MTKALKPHRYCVGDLHDEFSRRGIEIIVMAIPPTNWTLHTKQISCDHGISYYIEPSPHQVERWLLAGMF